MDITFDASAIKEFDEVLSRARERSYKDRTRILARIGGEVRDESRANAQAFNTDSTGELAAAVDMDGTAARKHIFANVRQAFFLEYGSPTTGAPRPWMSDPARKGANKLFAEISEVGDLW